MYYGVVWKGLPGYPSNHQSLTPGIYTTPNGTRPICYSHQIGGRVIQIPKWSYQMLTKQIKNLPLLEFVFVHILLNSCCFAGKGGWTTYLGKILNHLWPLEEKHPDKFESYFPSPLEKYPHHRKPEPQGFLILICDPKKTFLQQNSSTTPNYALVIPHLGKSLWSKFLQPHQQQYPPTLKRRWRPPR